MEVAPTPNVKVETQIETPLAAIYGSGDLPAALVRLLKKQHLRVRHLENDGEVLSILEKPTYVFFFTDEQSPLVNTKISFSEALNSARKYGAKVMVVFQDVSEAVEKAMLLEQNKVGWPIGVVEVRGKMDGPSGSVSESSAAKIIKAAFSSGQVEKQVILGKKEGFPVPSSGPPTRRKSAQDVFDQLKRHQKKSPLKATKYIGKIALLAGILVILSPALFQLFVFGRVGANLIGAKNSLARGDFEKAANQSLSARRDVEFSKTIIEAASPLFGPFGNVAEKYFSLLSLGESGSDLAYRLSKLGPRVDLLSQGFIDGKKIQPTLINEIRGDLGPVATDLGTVEIHLPEIASGTSGKLMRFLGLPVSKLDAYLKQVTVMRRAINQMDNFLAVWEELVPSQGRKTYLLVFQNGAELRPTGGFIGSYGLVTFDSGKLFEWKIFDVYTADNQLRGQINPPDEILHFLGQPNWYMRDANWAADFPLTAKRLIWFLEKETGQKADGVIGVNLAAVQKILRATGPLSLPDLNQTVSESDFFVKAEYNSEINFFAGSTGKKDFLGATANAILGDLTSNSGKNIKGVSQAFIDSLNEKEILLYFNSPLAQKAALSSGWAGTVELTNCQRNTKNCLMIVEANLGANKANYFLKRSLRIDAVMSKGGDVDNAVTILYRNDSATDTWPGGTYKNYLRFLIPYGSKVTGLNIGDDRAPVVSQLLTAEELSKVGSKEFFVFQSMESGFTSVGALVEVPMGESKTIVFKYRIPTKLSFTEQKTNFDFYLIKQPGTNPDYFDFTVEYPGFLAPVDTSINGPVPLVFPQKLIYNSDNQTDRQFEVKFKNIIL